MIYLLTAIGLSPGGSTHLHTNNTQNNTKQQYIHHNNFGRVRAVPRLGQYYPGSTLSVTSTLDGSGWSTLQPREGPGTHCIGGWVDPRVFLDECEKSRPHQDSIPGPPSPQAVAIPTTLPGPRIQILTSYKIRCCRTYLSPIVDGLVSFFVI